MKYFSFLIIILSFFFLQSPKCTEPEPPKPCPENMILIEDTFCIDKYEAYIEGHSPYEVPTGGVAVTAPNVVPQGYISGDIAQKACLAAGKRLCTINEWMRTCQGPYGYTYPYGNTYDPEACNVTRDEHPINSYWGNDPNKWDYAHMNDPGINQQPDTVDLTGSNPKCVTYEGAYDMHGNLHEWISDPAGTFKGGYYADGSINGKGCYYTTTAHSFTYHDYSTGFRCCAEKRVAD